MKYSWRDLYLVAMAIFQFLSMIIWALSFDKISAPIHVAIFIFELFIFYYNPIVITHNFLHTPFFRNSELNRFFSIFNSMNLSLPQIIYKYHHLNHHRHNNSLEDPSSTYLYGKNHQQEHWISYCAFSLFRDGTQKAWAQIIQKGEGHLLLIEILSVIVFWITLICLSWKFFLLIHLPLFYCGYFLAHVENYYEHYMARSPSDRFGNAVSFYSDWYNRLMFNEGYHQEHHISPQEHWTKRLETKNKFEMQMKKAGAYEARFPPLLGMFEK